MTAMTDIPVICNRSCLLLIAIPLLACIGCGGGPQAKLSSTQLQAINFNQRGLRAESRGDHTRALDEFASALRLHSAIDNKEGKIVALINSARVCRLKGDLGQAKLYIGQAIILSDSTSQLFQEVAFEKALISFKENNSTDAITWLKQITLDDSRIAPGRHNLLGRILFQNGALAEARTEAKRALELAQRQAQREEESNSLRLLGDIARSRLEIKEANDLYEQALSIDKNLGKSHKIAVDLRCLAQLANASDNSAAGIDYLRRAFAVSSAAGDNTSAASDLLEMVKVYEKSGNSRKAAEVQLEYVEFMKNQGAAK